MGDYDAVLAEAVAAAAAGVADAGAGAHGLAIWVSTASIEYSRRWEQLKPATRYRLG